MVAQHRIYLQHRPSNTRSVPERKHVKSGPLDSPYHPYRDQICIGSTSLQGPSALKGSVRPWALNGLLLAASHCTGLPHQSNRAWLGWSWLGSAQPLLSSLIR